MNLFTFKTGLNEYIQWLESSEILRRGLYYFLLSYSYQFSLVAQSCLTHCDPMDGSILGLPAAAAESLQSCPTLCDPIGGSPPGSVVPGILQARTLEWVAISFSNA